MFLIKMFLIKKMWYYKNQIKKISADYYMLIKKISVPSIIQGQLLGMEGLVVMQEMEGLKMR